jgi:ABC-type enterobactin transport system permease subunit
MDRLVLVIILLGTVALVCLGGVIFLAASSLSIPDVLVATTGAAVGSLGSLIVTGVSAPARVDRITGTQ